jgi:hypothetical protein
MCAEAVILVLEHPEFDEAGQVDASAAVTVLIRGTRVDAVAVFDDETPRFELRVGGVPRAQRELRPEQFANYAQEVEFVFQALRESPAEKSQVGRA